MNSKILLAGFACLSMLAAAQSNEKQQKPSTSGQVSAPRDLATGQASGRKINQKAESDGIVHRDVAARESSTPSVSEIRESPSKGSSALRESPSKASDGKTSVRESSSPSESEIRESPSKGSSALRESPTRASTGKTSVRESSSPSETENSQAVTPSGVMVRESPSKASLGRTSVKVDGNGNRVATGDVNGDGKAEIWSPRSNKTQVAAGDVDGDGAPDVTATSNSGQNTAAPRDLATGQASGKRQHKPLTIRKEVGSSPSTPNK